VISINFPEPTTLEWTEWRNECGLERDQLITDVSQGASVSINNSLYKKQSHIFFDRNGVFAGKCIFCESILFRSQIGDVEHFRPKKGVQNLDNSDVTKDGAKHLGYYWLAYDWTNLLPACIRCNRPNTDRVTGTALGKRNYFPLVEDFRSYSPDEDYSQEKPLFLNPVIDKIDDHIEINSDGVLFDKTVRGRVTIDVLGLNDRGLTDARREVYETVLIRTFDFIQEINPAQRKVDYLMAFKTGTAEFSMAGKKAMKDAFTIVEERREVLNG